MKWMEWGGWVDLFIVLPLQIIGIACLLGLIGFWAYSTYLLVLVGWFLLQ